MFMILRPDFGLNLTCPTPAAAARNCYSRVRLRIRGAGRGRWPVGPASPGGRAWPRRPGPARDGYAGRPRGPASVVVVSLAVAVPMAGWRERRGHGDGAAGRHQAAGLHGDDRAGRLP